jgi:hypothetical protein
MTGLFTHNKANESLPRFFDFSTAEFGLKARIIFQCSKFLFLYSVSRNCDHPIKTLTVLHMIKSFSLTPVPVITSLLFALA